MSVLRTISCCDDEEYLDCPTCSPSIKKLVSTIPMIMRNQSSILCPINKSLIQGNNYPIVLPNGNIYSSSGLNQVSTESKYRCPKTGKSYKKEACSKAFLS